jgi:hypothetical protein
VIGVAVVGGIAQHNVGPTAAQHRYNGQPVIRMPGKETIRHTEGFAKGGPEDAGGIGSFHGPQLRCTPRTKFATAEVEDTECFPLGGVAQQGAGSTQLHIVGMYANGQNIYFCHSEWDFDSIFAQK